MLSERLKRARKEAGKTLDAAAKESGIGRRTIARYEAGQGSPDTEYLARLASIYAKPIQWFFENGTEPDNAHS